MLKPAKPDPKKKWVAVCLSPALIDQFKINEAIVVVIDVLRATTAMCAAFDNGVRSMIPVLSVEEGRAAQAEGFLVAGERNGEQIEGFDFGNSPLQFLTKKIAGKDIVITTTNGTKAIKAAVERDALEVVIGAFSNYSILTHYLLSRNENVVLLCSGWKDQPNLEDTIFAGAMVNRLRKNYRLYEDTALMAETVYRVANRRKRYFLRSSSHFNRLFHILQIQKDVKYSLRRDVHPVIPKLYGERLMLMDSPYVAEFGFAPFVLPNFKRRAARVGSEETVEG
jgi:2-phosphosulfolactate phosphatase